MAKSEFKSDLEIVNRKAEHEYFLVDTYEAGIMLKGTEVKSVRKGHANLNDAYCFFKDGELYVKSMYIKEYSHGTDNNHETRRDRKLLLKKSELKKLHRRVTEKGMTIVPYKIFLSDRGLIKLEIALASGKRSYDKRQAIKEKESKRDLDRLNKMRL